MQLFRTPLLHIRISNTSCSFFAFDKAKNAHLWRGGALLGSKDKIFWCKKRKKLLTSTCIFGILFKQRLERCPSGLRSRSWKPVTPKGAVGSNPTFSVSSNNSMNWIHFMNSAGEVPKWLKGLPWKGSRSLIAARGFKSLLLRLSVGGWYAWKLILCMVTKARKTFLKKMKKSIDKIEWIW